MHKDSVIVLEKTQIIAGKSYLLGFFEDSLTVFGVSKSIDGMAQGAISLAIKNGFKAEKGELKMLYPAGKLDTVLLLGLGKKEKFQADSFMDSFADAIKGARNAGIKEIRVAVDSFDVKDAVKCIALSSSVGSHRFMQYKTQNLDKVKNLERIVLITENPKEAQDDFNEAQIIADAMRKTRDLVNTPPNIADTDQMAEYAKKIASKHKLKCTILDEGKMKSLGMGCMVAVGKGSASRPKMAILEYSGGGKEKPLVLVGKGITFDSGGYNLKPTNYINNMKDDKAGAVTVMHVIAAASQLKLKVNLIVVIALAENMVSHMAYRPDDILTAHNGMTIEITNTDAEGRLVLADALSYAATAFKPKAIIDIATLTGASMVALGHFTTPIVGNDEGVIESLRKAAAGAGERVWQLPLWDEYAENIKSDIADIKNATDGPDAGVIIGAMFLKNFVHDVPWAHLDIGTTVWSKAEKGMKQKGATAVSVRTLLNFVKNWK